MARQVRRKIPVSRAKEDVSLIREMQTKPRPQPQRLVWDIFSSIGGALQILADDGTEIINVAPHKTVEIHRETKAKLDASSHFQSLVTQGKVRVA